MKLETFLRCSLVCLSALVALASFFRFFGFSTAKVCGSFAPETVGYKENITHVGKDADQGGPINYFLQPDLFARSFASCLNDDSCKIFYRHIGKTGGTTIENVFASLLDTTRDTVRQWNCTHKFTSAEYGFIFKNVEEFEEAIRKCKRENKTPSQFRALALVSFRSPIPTTVSFIHQHCNKNRQARSQETLEACQRCSYEHDKEHWNNFTRIVTTQLSHALSVSHMMINGTQAFTINNRDLNSFFEGLSTASPAFANASFKLNNRKANLETTTVCNFHMPSSMMRELSMAETIYHNLTLGI